MWGREKKGLVKWAVWIGEHIKFTRQENLGGLGNETSFDEYYIECLI